MEEIYQFLRSSGCFYFATCDGDKPRVRPFGVIEIYEGRLYFLTGKQKKEMEQIHKNPNVEICATQGERWIRVEGSVEEDDRREAKKFFLDKNPQLRGMYNEDDDRTQLLYLEHATATISSFVEEPHTITF